MAAVEQNFSGALATWKNVNLSELQKTLDAQGIEVVENQKESVVGRKALADRTKDFKKIPDEDKLTAFKTLLKAYQTEIDSLTKRSKSAENAFLNIYKVLAEAPDPYPLLEAAVDQTVRADEVRDLQAEVQRLRDDNADLRKRNSELAKADAKVEQLEHKMEEMIREKVVQKENELHATYDEKIMNYEEREQDLQRQVTLVRTQLKDLRMSNESNQAKLMDQTQRQDQEVISKLAEVDMMVADLERANSRVATVERRNELLRAEIEAIRSGNNSTDRMKDLEKQVVELESESERLSKALDVQGSTISDLQGVLKKKTDESARDVHNKDTEIDQLKLKLRKYNDYDEIKRELEIMKYVEFAGQDEDLDEDTESSHELNELGLYLPNPNPEKANAQQGKSLEVLLAIKNKRILEELTRFRILHGELEASLQAAEERLAATDHELERQKVLNEKLEDDLLHMDKHKMNGKPDGSGTPSEANSSDALAGIELGKRIGDSPARTTPIPFSSSADTSILPIVTGQRDRFRQRNAELEEELRKQFQVISELRAEIRSLQTDNLKLYEKVRYMQSYQEGAASSSRGRQTTSTLDPLPPSTKGISDDMNKYHTRYEEAMNPFEAFRGREAARAYSNLNPVERGVFILTRMILGNRRARTAFIFYALGLHILVMLTIYEWAMSSNSQVQKQPYRL